MLFFFKVTKTFSWLVTIRFRLLVGWFHCGLVKVAKAVIIVGWVWLRCRCRALEIAEIIFIFFGAIVVVRFVVYEVTKPTAIVVTWFLLSFLVKISATTLIIFLRLFLCWWWAAWFLSLLIEITKVFILLFRLYFFCWFAKSTEATFVIFFWLCFSEIPEISVVLFHLILRFTGSASLWTLFVIKLLWFGNTLKLAKLRAYFCTFSKNLFFIAWTFIQLWWL